MLTVDELLAQVASRGLRVANLFQFQPPDGQSPPVWNWQANLTDGERAWEFGRGETPVEALQAALAASTGPGVPRRQTPVQAYQPTNHQPLPTLEDDEVMI